VLQDVLERFDGTLILVSHDRYLVDRLATQIWELRDGRLHVFDGTYQELLARREREAAVAKETAAERRPPPANRQQNGARSDGVTVASLEERIAEAESLLAQYSQQLQDESEAGNYEEVTRLGEEYTRTKEELDSLVAEWAAVAAQAGA